jgi:hypothetical protein
MDRQTLAKRDRELPPVWLKSLFRVRRLVAKIARKIAMLLVAIRRVCLLDFA